MIPHRFYALDALRGVAALCVVVWHWQHFFFIGSNAAPVVQAAQQPFGCLLKIFYTNGALAVDLFFCLSGFIFFWLYAKGISEKTMSARTFLILRFSRLYPLHFITLLFAALGQAVYKSLTGSGFVYGSNDAYHFVLNLLLASSIGIEKGMSFNGPVWSVSVEAALYVMFFVLCRLNLAKNTALPIIAFVGLFLVGKIYFPIGSGIGSFFLGGCAFRAFEAIACSRGFKNITRALVVVTGVLWVATILSFYTPWSLSNIPLLWRFSTEYPIVVLFPLTVLTLALAEAWRGTLGRRIAVLGDISYSSYLLHFPLQLGIAIIVVGLGINTRVFYSQSCMIVFFVLLMTVSLASHRYVEMPAQRYIRRMFAAPSR